MAFANTLSRWPLEWALAPDSKASDRDRAQTAARFGSEIFKHQLPYQVEVLAALYARSGDFSQAVEYQRQAIQLLTPGIEDRRPAMEERLELYTDGKPLPRE